MCIIAHPVDHVGATQIFVAPDASRQNQITVYSNVVNNTTENNSMILPVPYPDTISFVDLSNYPTFFKDCNDCFVVQNYGARSGRSIMTNDSIGGKKTLEVHRVGGYLASIAKSLDEIKQADSSIFNIPNECINVLDSYPKGYGFIICKLEQGTKEYHPFAYTHAIEDTLFIPTKHYHAKKQLKKENSVHKMLFPEMHRYDDLETFDHDIYIYNGVGVELHFNININDIYTLDKSKVQTMQSKLPFDLGELKTFTKYTVKGMFTNVDLTANIIYTSKSKIVVQPESKIEAQVCGTDLKELSVQVVRRNLVVQPESKIKVNKSSSYCCTM
jgi:hypothetical protein